MSNRAHVGEHLAHRTIVVVVVLWMWFALGCFPVQRGNRCNEMSRLTVVGVFDPLMYKLRSARRPVDDAGKENELDPTG